MMPTNPYDYNAQRDALARQLTNRAFPAFMNQGGQQPGMINTQAGMNPGMAMPIQATNPTPPPMNPSMAMPQTSANAMPPQAQLTPASMGAPFGNTSAGQMPPTPSGV